jgi:hypothetical protein
VIVDLVLDVYGVHTQSDVKSRVEKLNIHLLFRPAGCLDRLQPEIRLRKSQGNAPATHAHAWGFEKAGQEVGGCVCLGALLG